MCAKDTDLKAIGTLIIHQFFLPDDNSHLGRRAGRSAGAVLPSGVLQIFQVWSKTLKSCPSSWEHAQYSLTQGTYGHRNGQNV